MNGALLTTWRLWDKIYYRCTRLCYVDQQNKNIFRVVIKKYGGKPLRSEQEVVISPGDYYVKLHFHNCQLAHRLAGMTGEMRLGLAALKEVKTSLPALAKFVAEHPNADKITGIVGTTILYRGAQPLGFFVRDIDSPLVRWYKTFFFKLILSLCHPEGVARIYRKSDKLVAKRVFMSKRDLLERYLDDHSHNVTATE